MKDRAAGGGLAGALPAVAFSRRGGRKIGRVGGMDALFAGSSPPGWHRLVVHFEATHQVSKVFLLPLLTGCPTRSRFWSRAWMMKAIRSCTEKIAAARRCACL